MPTKLIPLGRGALQEVLGSRSGCASMEANWTATGNSLRLTMSENR